MHAWPLFLQTNSRAILISCSLTLTNMHLKSFRKPSLVRNLGSYTVAVRWPIAWKIEIDEKKCFQWIILHQCGNHLGNVRLMPFFSPLPSINFHHASLPFQDSGWLSLLPIPISFGTSPFHTISTLCSHQFLLTIFSNIIYYKWAILLFHFLIHVFKASSKFMNKERVHNKRDLKMSRKIRNAC